MQPHVLFEFSPNDTRDELDERVQKTYSLLKQMIAGKSIKECHEIYAKFISAQPIPIQQQSPANGGNPLPTTLATTTIPGSNQNTQTATAPISAIVSPTTTITTTITITPNVTTIPPTQSEHPSSQITTCNNAAGQLISPTSPAPNPILSSTTTTTPTTTPIGPTPPQHNNLEDLTMALLVAILIEPELGQSRYYQDVITISKDGLTLFSTYLNMLVIEKLHRLRETAMRQVLWLTNQFIKTNSNISETILFSLMRQVAGGDLSTRNLRLIDGLLDLFIENRVWLINQTTFIVPTTIYTCMRLIVDHLGPNLAALRQKETDFVIGLIKEKFADSILVGRDFLRLLHQINKIPEFEKLWHDIFNNPKSLHSTFQGPIQMLSLRTPRRLILSRLTFDMERKLSYLATQVKFGNHKKIQDSFYKQYLSTPESLSLRCDLIRYICTVIHPSNEVLCSDIIPRWAIIGWLCGSCSTSCSSTYSRIALFYDWLNFDTKADNIMNIEPGILVMYYSMRSHPNTTASLLDFLCRLPTIFIPKLSDYMRIGIKKSLHLILEKRVIPSLGPLFDNPKHDPALKALLKETYPEFCAPQQQVTTTPLVDNGISTGGQQQQSSMTTTPSSQQPVVINPVLANPPNYLPLHMKQENTIDLESCQKDGSPQTDISPTGVLGVGTNLGPIPAPEAIPISYTNRNQNNTVVINNFNNTSGGDSANPVPIVYEDQKHPMEVCGSTILEPQQARDASDGTVPVIGNGQKQVTNNLVDNNKVNANNKKQQQQLQNRKTSVNQTTLNSQSANPITAPTLNSIDPSNKNNHVTKKVANQNVDEFIPIKSNVGSSLSGCTTNTPNSINSRLMNHNSTAPAASSNIQTISLTDNINLNDTPLTNNNDNNYELFSTQDGSDTPLRVLYPFMEVRELDFEQTISQFEDNVKTILEDLNIDRCNENRCNLMEKLISTVFDNNGNTSSISPSLLKELAHCLSYLMVDDFSTRIFPSHLTSTLSPTSISSTSSSQQSAPHGHGTTTANNRTTTHNTTTPQEVTPQTLENSISLPFFILIRHALMKTKSNSSLTTLLININKHLAATGFLILYFLRGLYMKNILRTCYHNLII